MPLRKQTKQADDRFAEGDRVTWDFDPAEHGLVTDQPKRTFTGTVQEVNDAGYLVLVDGGDDPDSPVPNDHVVFAPIDLPLSRL